MEHIPVDSSNLSQIGYEEETQTLEVTFKKSNLIYEYFDVPPITWEGLQSAESKGNYFNQNIKNSFRFAKKVV